MNISKIKNKFKSVEKEYRIWKNAVDCYEKYINLPLPEDSIECVFVAYLISTSATEAAKLLNSNGISTPDGYKFTSNYITSCIDNNDSEDENLNIAVKGILLHSRGFANRTWN